MESILCRPPEKPSALVEVGAYHRHQTLLLSLEDQLSAWRVIDADVWMNHVAGLGWFDAVVTASEHVQRVDDLEILYIDFGSPKANVERLWEAIKASSPLAWLADYLRTDPGHIRLAAQARQYEPGIHRVRINLVAHWEPALGRSVLQVREMSTSNGETLAAAEVLAAYALHDALLRRLDGENLPFADLAGFEVTAPGADPWASHPDLYWSQLNHGAQFGAYWSGHVNYQWAVPVIATS